MTEAGRKHLIVSEGVRSMAYVDEAGLLTIGIGHRITAKELKTGQIMIANRRVEYSKGLTPLEIHQLFEQDTHPREAAIRSLVEVPLSGHQLDALVSFAFNIGLTAFQGSTLLRLLNRGDYDAVPTQMRRWTKRRDPKTGELVDSAGLAARREREIELWNATVERP